MHIPKGGTSKHKIILFQYIRTAPDMFNTLFGLKTVKLFANYSLYLSPAAEYRYISGYMCFTTAI